MGSDTAGWPVTSSKMVAYFFDFAQFKFLHDGLLYPDRIRIPGSVGYCGKKFRKIASRATA